MKSYNLDYGHSYEVVLTHLKVVLLSHLHRFVVFIVNIIRACASLKYCFCLFFLLFFFLGGGVFVLILIFFYFLVLYFRAFTNSNFDYKAFSLPAYFWGKAIFVERYNF